MEHCGRYGCIMEALQRVMEHYRAITGRHRTFQKRYGTLWSVIGALWSRYRTLQNVTEASLGVAERYEAVTECCGAFQNR